jgi:hypothetical protein
MHTSIFALPDEFVMSSRFDLLVIRDGEVRVEVKDLCAPFVVWLVSQTTCRGWVAHPERGGFDQGFRAV